MRGHRLSPPGRRAFVPALAVLAMLLSGGPGGPAPAVAAPAQIFFDFSAPFGAQAGSYAPSDGAQVTGGVGRLARGHRPPDSPRESLREQERRS